MQETSVRGVRALLRPSAARSLLVGALLVLGAQIVGPDFPEGGSSIVSVQAAVSGGEFLTLPEIHIRGRVPDAQTRAKSLKANSAFDAEMNVDASMARILELVRGRKRRCRSRGCRRSRAPLSECCGGDEHEGGGTVNKVTGFGLAIALSLAGCSMETSFKAPDDTKEVRGTTEISVVKDVVVPLTTPAPEVSVMDPLPPEDKRGETEFVGDSETGESGAVENLSAPLPEKDAEGGGAGNESMAVENIVERCSNRIDDDNNGTADCGFIDNDGTRFGPDPNCFKVYVEIDEIQVPFCRETRNSGSGTDQSPVDRCGDTFDNDGDGRTDCGVPGTDDSPAKHADVGCGCTAETESQWNDGSTTTETTRPTAGSPAR